MRICIVHELRRCRQHSVFSSTMHVNDHLSSWLAGLELGNDVLREALESDDVKTFLLYSTET